MKTIAILLLLMVAAHADDSHEMAFEFYGNGGPGDTILAATMDGHLAFEPGVPHEESAKKAMEMMCALGPFAAAPYDLSIGSAINIGEDGLVVFGPGFKGNDEDRAGWLIVGRAYAERCTI